jgi:protocatechuate 3,4-dioxygenase beta subunit
MHTSSRFHVLACGIVGVALTSLLTAQDRMPTRDAQRKPEAVGSGTITGTIISDETSAKPVRRAIVNLSSSSDFLRTRVTITDDAGRFTFTSLPAANFSLSANKPGYVTAYYGGKRPARGPGVPIALADGQRLAVSLKMLRGAVVTGTVSDPSGRPIQAQVQVMQYQTIGGERILQPAPGASFLGSASDDRGIYRIYGLAPGEFIISASVRSASADLRLVGPGEIDWARQLTQPGSSPTPPPAAQTVGFATIYYPGTPDAAAASVVSLSPGEERTGIDISLQMVPTARIEGTIVDPDGRRATTAQVTLLPKIIVGDMFLSMPRATVADGRFVAAGVPPGSYVVTARGRGAGPVGAPAGGRAGAAAPSLWAMTDITVSGQNLSGLELQLQPGLPLSGRVAFESATGQKPANITSYRASLGPWRSGTGTSVGITVPAMPLEADGTFRFASVVPGRYGVSAYGGSSPPGETPAWVMKSVTASGRDVTDQPLDIRPRDEPPEIVITFTDKVTEITGTLLDPAGRPTSGLSIIVVPVNREFWNMNSRRIRPVTPASDGKFKLAGLPPGEYYIAAVTDYEYSDLYDASFLEQLTAGAFKITLGEGEKKVQDIRMGGGRP